MKRIRSAVAQTSMCLPNAEEGVVVVFQAHPDFSEFFVADLEDDIADHLTAISDLFVLEAILDRP